MLVLDMNQRLQQGLLTHFLQSRGFRVESREAIRPADWPATTLLTDKPAKAGSTPRYGHQIWLLPSQSAAIDCVHEQVKGLLACDCELTELETCVRQVLLHQSYVSPVLLSQTTKRIKLSY